MLLQTATLVLAGWQGIVLIVLCFASLIIALYCLFFMVPLRQFVERINSLGGGMKGIQAHVDGLRTATEKRIETIEAAMRQDLARTRSELEANLNAVAENLRKAQAGLQRLEQAAQGLQAEIRENASDARKLSSALQSARSEWEDLRNDFQALEVKLTGSLRQIALDSWRELEGAALSALESVQDEMLRGTSKCRASRLQGQPPKISPARTLEGGSYKDSRRRPADKIISAEPLFAGLDKADHQPEPEREEGQTVRDGQEHGSPAE